MTKETCGTCKHSCNTHLVKGRGPSNAANHVCLVLGSLIPDWWYEDNPNCGGSYWSERTDSLEQVTLDALDFVKCLVNTGCELDSGFAGYEAEYAGEQTRFTDIETSLRLRLHAHGVEVPQ